MFSFKLSADFCLLEPLQTLKFNLVETVQLELCRKSLPVQFNCLCLFQIQTQRQYFDIDYSR